MFTGIIKHKSEVVEKAERKKMLSLSFRTPTRVKMEKGKSLSINGICSTIKRFGKRDFEVDYMPETRGKTTVNSWKKGRIVNLEESVTLKTFIDGHIVQGHIDAIGSVEKIIKKGDSKILTIKLPRKYMKFISSKGSIAIDGISLTVTKTLKNSFQVALIPYSLKHTNLDELKKGDKVNIETDIFAKYLYNLNKKN